LPKGVELFITVLTLDSENSDSFGHDEDFPPDDTPVEKMTILEPVATVSDLLVSGRQA
jgi:hypothetical protein